MKSLRVLVVDDNPDVVDTQTTWLTLIGCDVRVATDGRAAVSVAHQFSPHVVLLDIGLPDLDGYKVARHLHASLAKRPTLVAVTGWTSEADRQRCNDAGFDHFFCKPVDLSALQQLLGSVDPSA